MLEPCEELGIPPLWSGSVEHVESAFWAIGSTFRLLKYWKILPTPELSERIEAVALECARTLLQREGTPLCSPVIVPIPQTNPRTWELRGGSGLRLAHLWATALERAGSPTPEILPLLELSSIGKKATPQARLDGLSRFLRDGRFQIRADFHSSTERLFGHPVWLVDDFITSGKTLGEAANCLMRLGLPPVRAFVLAIKPGRKNPA